MMEGKMIHKKYVLEVITNSEKVIESIWLDLAEVMDKYGATISPKNRATKKLLEDNSE